LKTYYLATQDDDEEENSFFLSSSWALFVYSLLFCVADRRLALTLEI
jgi:hypothetical protein